MSQKTAWQDFNSLPPAARRQVVDFIAFLHSRKLAARPRKGVKSAKLAKEPFVGIWRDRNDMRDSGAWVRKTRERDWMRHRA